MQDAVCLLQKIFTIFRLHHVHMRKDTRLSPLFCIASDEKLGGAWEQDYLLPSDGHYKKDPPSFPVFLSSYLHKCIVQYLLGPTAYQCVKSMCPPRLDVPLNTWS